MVIEAYTFSKKMNSTAQPTGSGTQISVVLKENTSVLNPHFLVHNYSFAHNYIKWGSRYYFVDDIISISHDIAKRSTLGFKEQIPFDNLWGSIGITRSAR